MVLNVRVPRAMAYRLADEIWQGSLANAIRAEAEIIASYGEPSWPTGPSCDFGAMRNLSGRAPVGAAQVPAVIRRDDGEAGRTYLVAVRATLIWPFVVRLLALVRRVNSGQVELIEPQQLQLPI